MILRRGLFPQVLAINPTVYLLRHSLFSSSIRCISYNNHVKNPIEQILIANRGEIALRVMRTAKKMGLKTVVVYSDVDAHSQHVTEALASVYSSAWRIGEASPLTSYLDSKKILEVAEQSGAQAIHPGYGFLSENAGFAEMCQSKQIKFIGPSAQAIRDMGQKNKAKEIMIKANVPVLVGYNGEEQTPELLLEEAKKIGFPVMIKPVCGGGGKGMRIVNSVDEFLGCLASSISESNNAFGNADMIIEKYIKNPRHVEVQVFGDSHGNYIHLWDRDCSIQRRHQKIIEEAPAPGLDLETRQRLGNTAVEAARAVNYEGAGTVEFIMDEEGKYFFMEMNTRLQVEHPVTEAITGVDLVEWQIRVAQGERLPLEQSDIPLNGYAIEARIYAEDIDRDTFQFMPTAGELEYLKFPLDVEGVRVDSGVREGDVVSCHYDPMIAKIIAFSSTSRKEAIQRLIQALNQTHIGGLCNNVDFVRACLSNPIFLANDDGKTISTNFIEENSQNLLSTTFATVSSLEENNQQAIYEGAIVDVLFKTFDVDTNLCTPSESLEFFRINHSAKRKVQLRTYTDKFEVNVQIEGGGKYLMECEDHENPCFSDKPQELFLLTSVSKSLSPIAQCPVLNYTLERVSNGKRWSSKAIQLKHSILICGPKTYRWDLPLTTENAEDQQEYLGPIRSEVLSPIPGVVTKILTAVGEAVKKGQELATLTSMKMEFVIRAPCDGVVKTMECKLGQAVRKNFILIKLNDVTEK